MDSILKSAGGREQLRDFLLGSALVGGGGGLGIALLNQLRHLQRRRDESASTSKDDDTIYINIPEGHGKQASSGEQPQSDFDKFLDSYGPSIGLAGSVPVAVYTAHLVRKAHQKWKRNELQKELDAAQSILVRDMHESKSASVNDLVNIIGAAPLLALTAALAGSYHLLKERYPVGEAVKAIKPKRFIVRTVPKETEEEASEEGMVKQQAVIDELCDSTLRLALVTRNGGASGLGDVVKCAASGMTQQLKLALECGPEAMFAWAKSAAESAPRPSRYKTDLAIGWLTRDPELEPTMTKLAVAEVYEAFPGMLLSWGKAAATSESGPALVKIAAILNAAIRQEYYADECKPSTTQKQAAILPGMEIGTVLEQALRSKKDLADPVDTEGKPETEMVTGAIMSHVSADSKDNGPKSKRIKSKRWLADNKDIIDDWLAPKKED